MSSELTSPGAIPPVDVAWPPRAVIARTLLVVGIVLAFVVLFLFRNVLFCFLVGIVVATAVAPITSRFVSAGLRQSHAGIVVYLVLAILCMALILWGLPLVVEQTMAMIDAAPQVYEELRSQIANAQIPAISSIVSRLPENWPPVKWDRSIAAEVMSSLGSIGPSVGLFPRSVLLIVAVLLFAFYWSLQGPRTIAAVLLRIPDERRKGAREFADAAQERVGAFVRGQGLLCLAVGVLSFAAYLWIGLPYALLLAAIAGVLELVPYFGPTLGTVPALMAALATDPSKALWVVGAAAVIQTLESYVLVPRIMDRTVGVHPVVTLLAIVAFGSLFGTMGAILAIPMAAIVQLVIERILLQPEMNDLPAPFARDSVSRLRYEAQELIQDVRTQLRHKSEPASNGSDEVEDLVEALALDFEHELAMLEASVAKGSP